MSHNYTRLLECAQSYYTDELFRSRTEAASYGKTGEERPGPVIVERGVKA